MQMASETRWAWPPYKSKTHKVIVTVCSCQIQLAATALPGMHEQLKVRSARARILQTEASVHSRCSIWVRTFLLQLAVIMTGTAALRCATVHQRPLRSPPLLAAPEQLYSPTVGSTAD